MCSNGRWDYVGSSGTSAGRSLSCAVEFGLSGNSWTVVVVVAAASNLNSATFYHLHHHPSLLSSSSSRSWSSSLSSGLSKDNLCSVPDSKNLCDKISVQSIRLKFAGCHPLLVINPSNSAYCK